MDPVSQAALGAIAARAAAPRTLTGPVMLVGALAGAMPDIDVVFSPGGDFFDMLRTHRGITHSLFFAFTAGPLLGWLFARWWLRRQRPPQAAGPPPDDVAPIRGWMVAVTVAVLSHPLLDVLTSYGTQLLQPFSDARFAIHAMPIVDPLYTGLLLFGVFLASRSRRSRRIAAVTLAITCGYLALGWQLGVMARDYARDDLLARGETVDRIEAFPTLLQPWQRQLVARTPTRDLVGQMTMWSPCPPVWSAATSFSGPEVDAFLATGNGRTFAWFAMGWVHFSKEPAGGGERLVASDLRYSLDGDPAVSVFSVAALVERPVAGARVVGPVFPQSGRARDPARVTAALSHVFSPECRVGTRPGITPSLPAGSAKVAERQGGGGLDALHRKG